MKKPTNRRTATGVELRTYRATQHHMLGLVFLRIRAELDKPQP